MHDTRDMLVTLWVCCRQYQEFLEDLEEDPAFRTGVNIYKGHHHITLIFYYMDAKPAFYISFTYPMPFL